MMVYRTSNKKRKKRTDDIPPDKEIRSTGGVTGYQVPVVNAAGDGPSC